MFTRFFGRQRNPNDTLLASRYTLNVSGIEDSIKSQVLVIWVLIPSLVVLGSLDFTGNRTFSVTCADGYPWWAFLPILVVSVYHCKVENDLWQGVLDFLTRPEITIMQHYNIPGRIRRGLLILSVVEIMNLFTDLIFPFVARDCSAATSQIWIESWEHTDVPWAKVSARFIEKFGLWGLSATCVILSFSAQLIHAFWTVSRPFLNRQRLQVMTQCTRQNVPGWTNTELDFDSPHRRVSGLFDTAVKYAPVRDGRNADTSHELNIDITGDGMKCGSGLNTLDHVRAKLSGEQFAMWSAAAFSCIFPSVVNLCDAVADGRRWKFEPRRAMAVPDSPKLARRPSSFDDEHHHSFRLPGRRKELIDADELESIYVYSVRRFWTILVFNIIIGPLLSLYLQVTFFGLTFGLTSVSGKVKLLFSITVSLITLIHRSRQQVALMFNCLGILVFVTFIAIWTSLCLAKLYYAQACSSHVWNMTDGCLPYSAISDINGKSLRLVL